MPDYMLICQHCGKEFNSGRAHAQFCSTRCRIAHNRLDGQRNTRLKRVKDDVMVLFDDYETSEDVRVFFARLAGLIEQVSDDYTKIKSIQRALWDREIDL